MTTTETLGESDCGKMRISRGNEGWGGIPSSSHQRVETVGPSRETVEGHVWGKGEDREVVDGPDEGGHAACVIRSSGGGVRPGRRD